VFVPCYTRTVTTSPSRLKLAILGGCGHVGLPLALTFASKGCQVVAVDNDPNAVARVNAGVVGFLEEGADALLAEHLGRNLKITTDATACRDADVIICVIGTPIDKYLNPTLDKLIEVVDQLSPYMNAGQLFVLRSTLYPGATDRIAELLQKRIPGIAVAYCPERVAQGFAIREIQELPQLVSGTTPEGLRRARELFSIVVDKIIEVEPKEAELSKLFCNTWRYISFAVANQFYALCAKNGLDYYRILDATKRDYPRAAGLPKAGFAAGPCLFKDTMQLAAYYNNEFALGQTAMHINEGFPRLLMEQLRPLGLRDKTVGILGMAFKGDNDDGRDSLAFKLKKLLAMEAKAVLCSDEFMERSDFVPMSVVLERADVIVLGAPHSRYTTLTPKQPVLDVWNLLGRGGLLK
jgi:UDP-N-acetyl-D-mannosaminuronic acid dehydrogenase